MPEFRTPDGKAYIHPGTGEQVVGVTTALDSISKPALMAWGPRAVAEYVADNPDLIRSLLDAGDRDATVDMLKGAHFRSANRSANRGTKVHETIDEMLSHPDRQFTVDPELHGYIEAAQRFMQDFDITPVVTEATIWNRAVGYAGTGDVFGTSFGRPVVLDWKSVKPGKPLTAYGENALQLTAYAGGEFILTDDGEETPMPFSRSDIDRGLVVKLAHDGRYGAFTVDVNDPVLIDAFTGAVRLAAWQRERGGALLRAKAPAATKS